MKVLSVCAANYRTWEKLDLELPDGLFAIVGRNGAGKSGAVNVIHLTLFGGALAAEWNGNGVMELCCEFEHRGERYRARRQYDGKGRGKSTLDFERAMPDYDEADLRAGIALAKEGIDPGLYHDRWEPLTRESIAATEALICETIGLTKETFLASAFLAQGDSAAFTEAQPRDRKAILAEILELGLWDKLLVKARTDLRVTETKTEIARGRIEGLERDLVASEGVEGELAALRVAMGDAEKELSEAEAELTRVSEQYREAQVKTAELLTAQAKVEGLGSRLATIEEKIARADEAEATIPALEGQKMVAETAAADLTVLEGDLDAAKHAQDEYQQKVRECEQAGEEIARKQRERADLEARAATADALAGDVSAKITELEGQHAAICELCKQPLADEARASSISAYREQVAASEEQAQRDREAAAKVEMPELPPLPQAPPETDVGDLRIRIDIARAAQAEGLAIQVRLEQARTLRDEVKTPSFIDDRIGVMHEFREAELSVERLDRETGEVDVESIKVSGVKARAVRDEVGERVHAFGTRKGALEERVRTVVLARETLDELRGHVETELQRLDVLKNADRAYGRDGVPTLIVESTAIPQIERDVSQLLDDFDTNLRVELRTQREKKAGGLSEVLDIVILDPQGRERLYEEGCSGGEKTRINFAIRVAIMRLLKHRKGAELDFLIADEPEAGRGLLDEGGMEAMAKMLERLAETLAQVIVVSPRPELADRISQSVRVVRRDDHSELVLA